MAGEFIASNFFVILQRSASCETAYKKSATAHSPNRYKQAEEKRQRHNDNEIFAALRQRKMKMPTHKTAHLQAPTHKPMLQLAKEQFSC